MTTHELKSWPEFFQCVFDGTKTFELRKNDRDFQVGDTLHLREWEPNTARYTGRECHLTVTYLMQGLGNVGVIEPLRGLDRHYCILGVECG